MMPESIDIILSGITAVFLLFVIATYVACIYSIQYLYKAHAKGELEENDLGEFAEKIENGQTAKDYNKFNIMAMAGMILIIPLWFSETEVANMLPVVCAIIAAAAAFAYFVVKDAFTRYNRLSYWIESWVLCFALYSMHTQGIL